MSQNSPFPCCHPPVQASGFGPEIIADGSLTDGQTTFLYTVGDKWISDGDPMGTITIASNSIRFEKTGTSAPTTMNVPNLHDGHPIVGTALIPLAPNDYKVEFDIEENDDPVNMIVELRVGSIAAQASPSAVGHYVLYMYGVNPATLGAAVPVLGLVCTQASTGVARVTNISMRRILYS